MSVSRSLSTSNASFQGNSRQNDESLHNWPTERSEKTIAASPIELEEFNVLSKEGPAADKKDDLIRNLPQDTFGRNFLLPGSRQTTYAILENRNNFRQTSSVDVLRGCCNEFQWLGDQNDDQLKALTAETQVCACDKPKLLAFVVYLDRQKEATYGHQISLARATLMSIFSSLGIHDVLLPRLLGLPDYWSAFANQSYSQDDGKSGTYEFCCQHPRWTQKSRWDKSVHLAPCSVHLHYDKRHKLSTYFIAASKGEDWIPRLKETLRLTDSTAKESQDILESVAQSPFALHAIMSGIAFTQSQDSIASVRKHLMDQIIKVNDYSQPANGISETRQLNNNLDDRLMLENITKELHLVSQSADTGIANADMSTKLCEEMLNAYTRFGEADCKTSPSSAFGSTVDALHYILNSMRCQRNWLISYKARKDTAMNFVFNMVTQQDSAANVDIATKMAQDSSSMSSITILTMVFLPGTFVGTLFSSQVFGVNTSGKPEINALFWPFIGVVLALTLITVTTWYHRVRVGKFRSEVVRFLLRRLNTTKNTSLV